MAERVRLSILLSIKMLTRRSGGSLTLLSGGHFYSCSRLVSPMRNQASVRGALVVICLLPLKLQSIDSENLTSGSPLMNQGFPMTFPKQVKQGT
jgi:hypothetical protein